MLGAVSGQPSGPDPWLGQTIDGRYRVEALLGEGGLGMVYRATHVGIDRPVAVKVLLPDLLPNKDLRQRFDREVKTLSRLSHPHIVTLTDSGVLDSGVGYLVMELLEGETLEDRIRKEGALAPDRAITIARQILLAVAEAHGKSVLHRDIKPANVFLTPLADGGAHVKLLDFGLAKVRNDVVSDPGAYPTLTADGTIVGTPTYMAPEQAGGSTVDATTDVYAIGIVLFEMLAGKPPFTGESKLEIIRAHLASTPPDLSDVLPSLRPTPELRALIAKALAKDRADRYASARDMLAALDALPSPAATQVAGARPSAVDRSGANISGTEATISLKSSELATVDSMPSPKPNAATNAAPPKAAAPRPAAPKTVRRRNSRLAILALAAVALPAFAFAVWSLWPAGETDGQTDPDASGDPSSDDTGETPIATSDAGVAPSAAESPFERPLPTELREARRRIFRGRRLSDEQIRELAVYQRQHPDDPRPALLLARHHRFGNDLGASVRQYRAAIRIDPSSTAFPPMLPDLVRAASEATTTRAASQTIVNELGRAALPEVERTLARRDLDAGARRRLERLQRRLTLLPAE
jgi:serine/threonine protein kinase